MPEIWLSRFGAACGLVLALSIGAPGVVEAFTGETTVTSFVVGLGTALGAPTLTGLYLHQQRRRSRDGGRFATLAYAVNLLGLCLFAGVAFALNLVLFFVTEEVAEEVMSGPTLGAVLGAMVLFLTGSVMFGIDMVRAGVFPRIAALGYAVMLPLLALLAPVPDSPVISAVHVLAGAVLFGLSATVWRDPRQPVPHDGGAARSAAGAAR
ncbi:hypothetical protein [Streptomyces aidingensis]|uniref:Uncharacterized protein n=1 Tax=Streptomyces aidingensis TaxID=910347 RepID=A0A1I1S3W5_9ACTN|nr:hypothetical protein [Streptomyces aidingensis]SFD39238.1 hypothetical protein SAMN05421773_11484 [Streptomyces aidingensis]